MARDAKHVRVRTVAGALLMADRITSGFAKRFPRVRSRRIAGALATLAAFATPTLAQIQFEELTKRHLPSGSESFAVALGVLEGVDLVAVAHCSASRTESPRCAGTVFSCRGAAIS